MSNRLQIAPLLLVLILLPMTALEAPAQQASDRFAAAQVQLDHDRVEEFAQSEGFETTGFAQFMASPAGRLLRGAVGVAMIGGGIAWGDTEGTALAIAGGIPLSAAAFDLCYVSALMGGPIRGEDIRAAGR